MAQTVPTAVPDTFTAGDTISWKITLTDYPADDGWVLKYRFINAAGKFDITATADGADHLVSVAAATSAGYAAGTYSYQAYVEKGTNRHTVDTGSAIVKPNLAAQSAGYDNRSIARKTLEAIEAAMVAHGSKAWMQEYSIAGRTMKFRSVAEFMAFRSKMQQEVRAEEAAERIARGESAGNKLFVRF